MSLADADSLSQRRLLTTLPDDAATTTVPITFLLPADSPRLSGEDMNHVHSLAETAQELPPIIVHRLTMRVIDGMHRLRAAQLHGHTEVEVKFFDGPESDTFLSAVQSNTRHGLPLSLFHPEGAGHSLVPAHRERS